MLTALGVTAVVLAGVQAALFLDPRVPLAPASWAAISICIWHLFVLSKGGWTHLSTNDKRRFVFGIFAAASFLHFLQIDTEFEGWSSVYYFCGHKLQYCACNFRWNVQGWLKAVVLWQFVLSATLGGQQLIIQAGLGGLLPGEEAVTRESFISICWRLIPYWLNNWEQKWGAEVSSMTFELPHFAVELLIILPCCQIICSRLKVLVTPQVNVLLGQGQGGAEEGPFVREDFAPNVLQGFWERRPEQRRFIARVRSNVRVLAFLAGLTGLAALNATLVPLYLESQAAGAAQSPVVKLSGRRVEWLGREPGTLNMDVIANATVTDEELALLDAVRDRYSLYGRAGGGAAGAHACGDVSLYAKNVAKHAEELQRMQDPEHQSLIPLVESALAIMRLSCEKYFVLVAIYLAFLLFRDAPRPARAVIRLVARVSGIFQKVILFAFPAVCWLYNAGIIFSLFVSVVFWGGPLLALYETARAALREVSVRALSPATADQVDRMGGSCAICWGDMASPAGPPASPAASASSSAPPTPSTSAPGAACNVGGGGGEGADASTTAAAGRKTGSAALPASPVQAQGSERRQQRRQRRQHQRERDTESTVAEAGSLQPADVSVWSRSSGGLRRLSSSGSCTSVSCAMVGADAVGGGCGGASCSRGVGGAGGSPAGLGHEPGGVVAGPVSSSPAAASGQDIRGSACNGSVGDLGEGEGGVVPSMPSSSTSASGLSASEGEDESAVAAAAAAAAAAAEAKAAGWALPCGHAYHHDCLLQWMEQCSTSGVTPTCPMCQRGIQLQVRWRLPPFLRRANAGEPAAGTIRLLGAGGGGAAAAAGAGGRMAAGGAGGAAAAELAAGEELLDAVRHFAGHDAGLQVVGLLEHQRELQELLHEAPALEFGELLREAQPLIVQQQQEAQEAQEAQQLEREREGGREPGDGLRQEGALGLLGQQLLEGQMAHGPAAAGWMQLRAGWQRQQQQQPQAVDNNRGEVAEGGPYAEADERREAAAVGEAVRLVQQPAEAQLQQQPSIRSAGCCGGGDGKEDMAQLGDEAAAAHARGSPAAGRGAGASGSVSALNGTGLDVRAASSVRPYGSATGGQGAGGPPASSGAETNDVAVQVPAAAAAGGAGSLSGDSGYTSAASSIADGSAPAAVAEAADGCLPTAVSGRGPAVGALGRASESGSASGGGGGGLSGSNQLLQQQQPGSAAAAAGNGTGNGGAAPACPPAPAGAPPRPNKPRRRFLFWRRKQQ